MRRAWSCFGGMIATSLLAGCSVTVSATDASSTDAGSVDRAVPIDLGAAIADVLARPDLPAPDDGGAAAEDRPDVTSSEDVPGASCETATELRDGDVLRGQRFNVVPSAFARCRGETMTRPIRWYRVSVSAGAIAVVRAVEEGGERTRLSATAMADCGATECSGNNGEGFSAIRYRNESDGPRTLRVAIAQNSGPPGVAVTVSAYVGAGAADGTCATATPLTPGVTLRAQDLGTSIRTQTSCVDGSQLPYLVRYYSITIPARTALSAVAASETPPNATTHLGLQPPCGMPGCLTHASGSGVAGASLGYDNTTTSPQPVIMSLIYREEDPAPLMSVTATLRPLPP